MIQKKSVNVVVMQGHCLLCDLLAERLEHESWIHICALASDIEETERLLEMHNPCVLIICVSLNCEKALTLFQEMKNTHAGLSILAVSCDSEFEEQNANEVMLAGADGIITAADTADHLIEAIWRINSDNTYPKEDSNTEAQNEEDNIDPLVSLSKREAEVYCFTGCGYVPQRIADHTGLSVKTIESYRERIRKKMDIASGGDLLFSSSSYMRNIMRWNEYQSDESLVKALVLATR